MLFHFPATVFRFTTLEDLTTFRVGGGGSSARSEAIPASPDDR